MHGVEEGGQDNEIIDEPPETRRCREAGDIS